VAVSAASAAARDEAVRDGVLEAVPYSPAVAAVRAASALSRGAAYAAAFYAKQVSPGHAAEAVEEWLIREGAYRVAEDGAVYVLGRDVGEILRGMGVSSREAAERLLRHIVRRVLAINQAAAAPSPAVARMAGLDPSAVPPELLAQTYRGRPVWDYLAPEEKRRYVEAASGRAAVLRRMLRDPVFRDAWREISRLLRDAL